MLGLERLDNARTPEQFLDAVWDLRDTAHDHPQLWSGLTAETFLQSLAESLDNTPTATDDTQATSHLLAQAFRRTLQLPH